MMMAADGWYIYNGREAVRRNVTRVRLDKSLTVIPASAFYGNRHIKEVDCHDRVKTVGRYAFRECPSLTRVIMPGVKVVEREAFFHCEELTSVECGELERIGESAFYGCESLGSIDLPSAKIVEPFAFYECIALMNVEFGKKLESIIRGAFYHCKSLEQITIPLKDGIFTDDKIFQGCENLKHVDLIEGELHETIAALLLEDWKNYMAREILSINQILSNTPAGGNDIDDVGGKARALRRWIRSVLRKIIQYKTENQRYLNEAASTLQHALPQDILMNNVLSFLELPSYTFEVGDHEEESEDDSDDEERGDE